MISTVTTSTVTTVSLTAFGTSLAVIGVIFLLNLLVQKELVSCKNSKRAQLLGKALHIGIVPLLLAFLMLIAHRMIEVLY